MATINTFADVQSALDNFITNNNITLGPPHGNFWENGNTPGDQYNNFVNGDAIPGYPILQKGSTPGTYIGKDSNIIKALSGITPFDGSQFPRMPPPQANPNNAYLDQDTIDAISAWIDNGAKQ